MKDNYRFTDLEDKDKREEWRQKELLEHLDKYFVLHYNLGEHILFYGNKEI